SRNGAPRMDAAALAEDADASGADEQTHDDQRDPGEDTTADQRHDAGDHQDHRDHPEDERDPAPTSTFREHRQYGFHGPLLSANVRCISPAGEEQTEEERTKTRSMISPPPGYGDWV